MLEIVTLTLGPAQTNAYLVADSVTHDAAVIDPSWDGELILSEAQSRGWRIAHLWYTHAHFDHIGGAAGIADSSAGPLPLVALHPDDHVLWRAGGGGALYGFNIDPGPEPTIDLYQGQILRLGVRKSDWQSDLQDGVQFEVRFTPGHTRGHCIFYVAESSVCFCGDLIFAGSVGRTDLPGGDFATLERSIREQIFTLPDDTRLLSGHGPVTMVGREKRSNPFVGGR